MEINTLGILLGALLIAQTAGYLSLRRRQRRQRRQSRAVERQLVGLDRWLRRQIGAIRTDQQRLSDKQNRDYGQIEALFSMFSLLKINHPMPPMRGWALSPDCANTVISLVHQQRPKLIVELGSGVSTLVAAYCLAKRGEGTILSLEHERQYAETTMDNLARHGLHETAKIVHAPLEEVELRGKTWLWYDISQLESADPIDILIVDGPPGNIQKLSRYPALPILFDRLSQHAVVLLDDCTREDENSIVQMWLEEFDGFECERLNSEKGTVILRRTAGLNERHPRLR